MDPKESTSDTALGQLTSYQAPRLIRFGSVRNLTGGSGGQASDGGGIMTMM